MAGERRSLGAVDIQFEINGDIIERGELEEQMGVSASRALFRMVERIEKAIGEPCQRHQEFPAITILVSDSREIGVRVGGCCQLFVSQAQEHIKTIFAEMTGVQSAVASGMTLRIEVRGTGKKFEFDLARINRLVIGRIDPDTGDRPDIDLVSYGAYENGVSRRHASIVQWNRSLFLVDEGSPNGTYLNDERLPPNVSHPLKFGDHIRIGRLVLDVTLDYAQGAAI
jgi:hypothetical protein